MIVDASALVAIVMAEPGWTVLSDAIGGDPTSKMSASTLLEASIVVQARGRLPLLDAAAADLEIVPFDRDQALVARAAYQRYGKGSGSPARLNFGDCMAYALARTTDEPLLFKGDAFTHTDVVPAMRRA